MSASEELMDYIKANPSVVQQYTSNMDPVEWANESFQFVRTNCYNYTTGPDGGKIYKIRSRLLIRSVPQLGDAYYDENLPVVKERLVAAGVRLAKVLNTVLAGHQDKGKFASIRII